MASEGGRGVTPKREDFAELARSLDAKVARIQGHIEKYWDLIGLIEAHGLLSLLSQLQQAIPQARNRSEEFQAGYTAGVGLAIRLILKITSARLRIDTSEDPFGCVQILRDFSALYRAKGDVHKAARLA